MPPSFGGTRWGQTGRKPRLAGARPRARAVRFWKQPPDRTTRSKPARRAIRRLPRPGRCGSAPRSTPACTRAARRRRPRESSGAQSISQSGPAAAPGSSPRLRASPGGRVLPGRPACHAGRPSTTGTGSSRRSDAFERELQFHRGLTLVADALAKAGQAATASNSRPALDVRRRVDAAREHRPQDAPLGGRQRRDGARSPSPRPPRHRARPAGPWPCVAAP